MICPKCKHRENIYAFLEHVDRDISIEKWNKSDTTFKCPKCGENFK